MNADPTDTQSPHLDLGDLIAEANGQPIGDAAREHLAGCERCRLEASRWILVADGVRGLAAAASEAAAPEAGEPGAGEPGAGEPRAGEPGAGEPRAVPVAYPSHPGRPQRVGRRILARPARRALLVAGSAAAAAVLLVGVGIGSGLVQVNLSGPSAETVLTAVSGCAALESANGTLEQVNASSLVIKTASGQPVTVTTTAATEAGEVGASGSLLGDITDGAAVTVSGLSSDGTIAAFFVIVANPAQQHPQPPPGMVIVKGTVADARTAGFTVVTPNATRVPVTTSGHTAVSVLNASLAQFPVGASILAIGSAGPDGTLSAVGVVAILAPPPASAPGGPPGGPALHAPVHVQTRAQGRQVHVRNCSPASIDEVLAAGG
jgi:hypothetical protein